MLTKLNLRWQSSRGFSLVELMGTLTVSTVLVTTAVPMARTLASFRTGLTPSRLPPAAAGAGTVATPPRRVPPDEGRSPGS